jgi:taurine dioxygenase
MPSHVPPASLATNDPMRLLEGRFDLDHHTGGLRGLGAVLPNVDLREDFNEEDISILKRASNDAGGIIVFPDQSKLSLQDHVAFGRKLGEIEPHAVASGHPEAPEVLEIVREPSADVVFGENWHSDNSFMKRTASYSILKIAVAPRYGSNDTLFASVEAAYEALSPTIQGLLQNLQVFHSATRAYSAGRPENSRAAMERTSTMRFRNEAPIMEYDVLHPLVVVHPETKRRSIFASPTFTTGIRGMHKDESDALLGFLYGHFSQPQFQARVSWAPHQVTMWDNRSLTHKGIADDVSEKRVVQRVSIRGSSPVGVDGKSIASEKRTC